MARREPTAGGDARRGRGGRGTSDKRKRRHARGRRRMGRHATAATHATTHRAPTQAAGQHPAGSVWHGASTSASVTPLLALRPEPPARGALLTLAGAEQGTLADAFLAWSAERDGAANRAWRRPGGLARMAGL